jgi:hypothetical protein
VSDVTVHALLISFPASHVEHASHVAIVDPSAADTPLGPLAGAALPASVSGVGAESAS